MRKKKQKKEQKSKNLSLVRHVSDAADIASNNHGRRDDHKRDQLASDRINTFVDKRDTSNFS